MLVYLEVDDLVCRHRMYETETEYSTESRGKHHRDGEVNFYPEKLKA